MSPVLRGIYRRLVRVAAAYPRQRVSALLLSSVRAEFRAAAPAGAAPLRGEALTAAEATAARTFEFLRRATHHGGTERALLQSLVGHADDAARGVMRPGSLRLQGQRSKLEPAVHRAWAARLAELNAELGVALTDTKIRAQTDTETKTATVQ